MADLRDKLKTDIERGGDPDGRVNGYSGTGDDPLSERKPSRTVIHLESLIIYAFFSAVVVSFLLLGSAVDAQFAFPGGILATLAEAWVWITSLVIILMMRYSLDIGGTLLGRIAGAIKSAI